MKKAVISVFLLLLISLVFSRASGSEPTPITVNLHEAATLQCYKSCSGLVTWKEFYKRHDILASCDQTSCQSQEGFQMLHDEYLKGNLSLIITDADFTKRRRYVCQCDDKDICDFNLKLKPVNHSVDVQAGKPFSLDLPISNDVEVTFKKSDDASDASTLCTVKGHKAQCVSSYEISSTFQWKEVKNSDGGVYIIRDTINDEVIGTYTVTVKGVQPSQCGSGVKWLAGIFGLLLLVTVVVIVVQCVQKRCPREWLQRVPMPGRMKEVPQSEEQQEPEIPCPVSFPVMDTGDVQEIEEKKKLNFITEDEDHAGKGPLETDPLVNRSSVQDEPPLSNPVPESSPDIPASSCVPLSLTAE